MLDALSKAVFHGLAGSSAVRRLASRYGMRKPSSFARRFIAGETVDEAIAAARQLEANGRTITLDQLGESVETADEATRAVATYLESIERIEASGVGRNLSLKLSQLGLDVDPGLCLDNIRRILDVAQPHDFFVRIDMESSAYVDRTLDMFDTLWTAGYRNLGTVLQSALKRSGRDLERLNQLGARVRLVKGAYTEPPDIAFHDKADVDAAFVRMTEQLLTEGHYPAIATHDPAILASACELATARDVGRDRFEFQMLFGVRRDLQASLLASGYRVRVYVPFGRQWFPYFMRRLGERPANVTFVVRSLVEEAIAPRRS